MTLPDAPRGAASAIASDAPPASSGRMDSPRPRRDSAAVTVAFAGAQPSPPAAKSRTEQFDCPECGHRFRTRTKSGTYSRCPKCSGQAIGTTVREKAAKVAALRLQQDEEAAKRRREHRRRASTPVDGPPADVATPAAPATVTPEPATPRRRPSPRVEASAPPPRPASPRPGGAPAPVPAPAAAATPPAEPPAKPSRSWFDRLVGSNDD